MGFLGCMYFLLKISLILQEDELTRSISSCRVEADVVNTWINFLEYTWALQTQFTEQKEKHVKYVHFILHCSADKSDGAAIVGLTSL